MSLIEREKSLFAFKCNGVITRQRITKNRVEKSILDYIITCEKLHDLMEEIMIDEAQTFSLMKYMLWQRGKPSQK